jgi:hypothetical protein
MASSKASSPDPPPSAASALLKAQAKARVGSRAAARDCQPVLLYCCPCVLPRPLPVLVAPSEPQLSICTVLLGRLPEQPGRLRLVLLYALVS